jgi:glycosyltransferase involved in cell wall biosynthesis
MKVLLFSNHYPASDAPTRGTYNRNVFNALARHAEVRVVGPMPWWIRLKRPKDLVLVQRETGFGLDAAFPAFWSVPRVIALHGHASFATLAPYLALVRRAFPWDVVVGSNAYPDGVGAADLAMVSRVPLVQNVIGSDVNELPDVRSLGPQIRWALARAERVVAVSGAMGERVVSLGVPRDRVVVQLNGVDGEEFTIRDKAEARARVGLDHRGPVVVYVGNVKVDKGAKVLVDAVAPLVRRHDRRDVLVCIVGGGEHEGLVADRVRELGLGDHVRLCGRQDHALVAWWIAAGDVLCLPSFMEGCPNVVLEALASGRPVVATDVGGIPEIVRDGETGILVPPRDPEALAGALAQALSRTWDPAAQRASVPYLSWDAVAVRYRDVIEASIAAWRQRAQG